MHAKETVYWPGLNDQLEQLILTCQLCLKYSKLKNKNTPQRALGHEVPPVSWSEVATDIFHYESQPYLLIVYYTNRFPIVRKLKSMSAQNVAEHFKSIFSEYGWPDTIVSRQWTMLCCRTVHKSNEGICSKSYHQFPHTTLIPMDLQKNLFTS